jgi:hypothetical protein
LQLFRYTGHVLCRPSLGISPNAGDLRIKQRAYRHELGVEPCQALFEALGLHQGCGDVQLLDASPRQFNQVLDGALGDPDDNDGMRQEEYPGKPAEDGIRREPGSERKLEKIVVGNNTPVSATWWLPVPLRPNVCQVSRISQCSAGTRQKRIIGPGPCDASIGEPPSIITQAPPIQSAFWHPLANGHAPVTFHTPRWTRLELKSKWRLKRLLSVRR